MVTRYSDHIHKRPIQHQVRGSRYSSRRKRRRRWKSWRFRECCESRLSSSSQSSGRARCRGGLCLFFLQNLHLRSFSKVRIRVQGPTPQSSMQSMYKILNRQEKDQIDCEGLQATQNCKVFKYCCLLLKTNMSSISASRSI